jgi:hypothetical protein
MQAESVVDIPVDSGTTKEARIIGFLRSEEGQRELRRAIHFWFKSELIDWQNPHDFEILFERTLDKSKRDKDFDTFKGRPDILIRHNLVNVVVECAYPFDESHLLKDFDYLGNEKFFEKNPQNARLLLLIGSTIANDVREICIDKFKKLSSKDSWPSIIAHLQIGFAGKPELPIVCFSQDGVDNLFSRGTSAKGLLRDKNNSENCILEELDNYFDCHDQKINSSELGILFGVSRSTISNWFGGDRVQKVGVKNSGVFVYTRESIERSTRIIELRRIKENEQIPMLRYDRDVHVTVTEAMERYGYKNQQSFEKELKKSRIKPIGFSIIPGGKSSFLYDRTEVAKWLQGLELE